MAKGKRLKKSEKELVIREGERFSEAKKAQAKPVEKKVKETPEQREIRILKKQAEKEAKKKAKKEKVENAKRMKRASVEEKFNMSWAKETFMSMSTKKLIIIVTALVLSCATVVFWLNRESISFDNVNVWLRTTFVGDGVGEGYPVSVSVTNAGNVGNINGNAVVLTDSELVVLDTVGDEMFTKHHAYQNPALLIEGEEIVMYDIGADYYERVDLDGISEKIENEHGIMSIKMSQNGKIALATQAENYASSFEVYTAAGEKQFVYSFSSSYITAIDINDDGTKGAVSVVHTEDGGLVSTIYIFDFREEEPLTTYEVANDIIYHMGFASNGGLYLIGDLSTIYADNKFEFARYDYDGQNITATNITNDKAIVSVSPYTTSGACTVLVFDNSAEPYMINTNEMVTSVDSKGVVIGVLEEDKVITYSIVSGQPIGICDAGFDAKSVTMINESDVYMLCMGEIKLDTLVNYS